MAAPTPVSAYLHSATMVKAGVFLLARMWPVLAGTEAWFYIVATTGLMTMVLGALIALFKDDLKALLAYSTVSHLGLMTMLLGFGTKLAAIVAVFHIINHLTFKAALFMTAGIVDHEAHTRDIKRLGGLRRLMPITFVIGDGGGAVDGGHSAVQRVPVQGDDARGGRPHRLGRTATGRCRCWRRSARCLSVAYSFRFIGHVFLGPVRDDYPHTPHDPPFGMWAAPALLVVLVVAIGTFPRWSSGRWSRSRAAP